MKFTEDKVQVVGFTENLGYIAININIIGGCCYSLFAILVVQEDFPENNRL